MECWIPACLSNALPRLCKFTTPPYIAYGNERLRLEPFPTDLDQVHLGQRPKGKIEPSAIFTFKIALRQPLLLPEQL
jgi:hypothetical protein